MGRHLVSELLSRGFDVTIATRGLAKDDFGRKVRRLSIDRTVEDCLRAAFSTEFFHVAFDLLALFISTKCSSLPEEDISLA